MSKCTVYDAIGPMSPAIPVCTAGLLVLLIVALVSLVGIAFVAGEHTATQNHPPPPPLTKTSGVARLPASAPVFDHASVLSATNSKPTE